VLFRVVHRQRDRPGQTARGDVVESEQESRTCDEHAAVKRRRQNQNKRGKPNQVLGTNAGRENKKHKPSVSERLNKRGAASLTVSPSDPQGGGNDHHFQKRDDDVLGWLKIKKRQTAKLSQTSQAK